MPWLIQPVPQRPVTQYVPFKPNCISQHPSPTFAPPLYNAPHHVTAVRMPPGVHPWFHITMLVPFATPSSVEVNDQMPQTGGRPLHSVSVHLQYQAFGIVVAEAPSEICVRAPAAAVPGKGWWLTPVQRWTALQPSFSARTAAQA